LIGCAVACVARDKGIGVGLGLWRKGNEVFVEKVEGERFSRLKKS
jgi:hypothetical protein